ncbi:MAG: hypothetical protein II797_06010, partial [Clostridia bacterium]|nr:hypothetical protein [Clostridia bacterium]
MKKLLIAAIAVIVCIPLVVAIVSYNQNKQKAPQVETITEVSLTNLSGKTYTFSSEESKKTSESEKMIPLLVNLTKNATKVTQLPAQISGKHYVILFSSKRDTPYKFYFTTNPETCYYTDDTSSFKIDAADATAFLETPYAYELFSSSTLPVLNLSGNIVTPASAAWNYRATGNSYVAMDTSPYVSGTISQYELSGGLGLSFSPEPDRVTAIIADASTGSEIFNGNASEISTLDLSGKGALSVRLGASWNSGETKDCYGEMQYTFIVSIAAPADFFLRASDTNQPGDVMTITAYNVDQVDNIVFSSTIDMIPPKFFQVDGYAVAILPVPLNAPAGNAEITLSYNGISKNLSFKVTKRTTKTSKYEVKPAVFNSYYNNTVIDTFTETLAPTLQYASTTQLWSGVFRKVYEDSAIKCGYGRTREIYSGS